jgi:hypothetical protein
MAVTATVLKNTNQEAIVKVAGTADSATIILSELVAATQEVIEDADLEVNLVSVSWTGLASSTVTIARNSVNIITVNAAGSDIIDMSGRGYVDTIENTEDIVVTIGGAEAQVWLTLRKASGYATKVEPATYGAYDDPTRVGASTTMSGSPDKV